MKPSLQVAEAVKKANKALGQLLKCISYRDKVHYINLYKQHVRCHLEFASQAWNPWLKQDIDLLEGVQKRAIKYCKGLHGCYEDKLQQVKLTSLFQRCNRGDMLQTYKILNKIDDVDYHTWFTKIDDVYHHNTRQASCISSDGPVSGTMNIIKPHVRLDIRKNFFSNRIVNLWNKLPNKVKQALSVHDFKVQYDKYFE